MPVLTYHNTNALSGKGIVVMKYPNILEKKLKKMHQFYFKWIKVKLTACKQ
jgi:hypothetical protein